MLTFLFCFLLTTPAEIKVEKLKALDPLPEDYAYYLQRPIGIEFDKRGRFYILDAGSRVIFVWEKDGTFLRHFGKQGEGPGEFMFQSRTGRVQGFVSVFDDGIFVYDGARRVLHKFSLDYEFEEAKTLNTPAGRTAYFSMTNNKNILIWQTTFNKEKKPFRELNLYDQEFNVLKRFSKDPLSSIRVEPTGERVIIAYSQSHTMFCDTANDEILVAKTMKPEIQIFNSLGNLTKTVIFKPLNNDVTPEDIKEFNMMPIAQEKKYKIEFPEKKPYFENMIPVDNNLLVYSTSKFHGNVSGVYINREGERLGTFRFACGENGGLWGARHRLVAIQTNDSGDFVIEELKLKH